MFHSLRAVLVVAALVSLPQFADAGPIQWGFKATSTVLGDEGTVLREVTGLTDTAYAEYFWRDPKQFGAKLPDPEPDNEFHSDIWRQQAMVTVTDELRGQSVNFMMTLDYIERYEIQPDGSLVPLGEVFLSRTDPLTFTLGPDRYNARSLAGDFQVSVEPGVVTPEPATFALAALGLGAVGLGRLRKRSSV